MGRAGRRADGVADVRDIVRWKEEVGGHVMLSGSAFES